MVRGIVNWMVAVTVVGMVMAIVSWGIVAPVGRKVIAFVNPKMLEQMALRSMTLVSRYVTVAVD